MCQRTEFHSKAQVNRSCQGQHDITLNARHWKFVEGMAVLKGQTSLNSTVNRPVALRPPCRGIHSSARKTSYKILLSFLKSFPEEQADKIPGYNNEEQMHKECQDSLTGSSYSLDCLTICPTVFAELRNY